MKATSAFMAVLRSSYWVGIFVIFPLALSPAVFVRLNTSGLRTVPAFRAVLLFSLLVLGITTLLGSDSGIRLAQLPSRLWRSSWPVKFIWLAIAGLLVSIPFSNYAAAIPALGSSARLDGPLVQAAWLGMFLVACGLAETTDIYPRRLLLYLQLGGLLTSVWIVLQSQGLDPIHWLSRSGVSMLYPAGAMGHGGIASAYLALILLTSLAFGAETGRWGLKQLVAQVLLAVGLAVAGGRAAWIGFAVGSFALALSALTRGRRPRHAVITFLAVSIAVAGGVLLSPHARSQVTRVVRKGPTADASVTNRLIAWRAAAGVIADHALFGVGPEGLSYVIWGHLTEKERAHLLAETIGFSPDSGAYTIAGNVLVATPPGADAPRIFQLDWDKAHSYFLDLAVEAGVFPATMVLAAVISILVALFRTRQAFPRSVGFAWMSFVVFSTAWFFSVSLDPIVWTLGGAAFGLARRKC